jgi:hypothetical protein
MVAYAKKTIGNLEINVPVGSLDKPCQFGEAAVKAIQNPGNWKLATGEFETADESKAEAIAYALDWYMGGHETREIVKDGVTFYIVSSKGYYHYIGA